MKEIFSYFISTIFILFTGSCTRINYKVFYEGYSNTKFGYNYLYYSKGVKSAHQKYYNVSSKNNEIIQGNRIDDNMRNNKQFFNRKGQLLEFQSLDTLDKVEHSIKIKYNKKGRKISQVYKYNKGYPLDSTIFTYKKRILKEVTQITSRVPHICEGDTSIVKKIFELKKREIKVQTYCKKENNYLLREYSFKFNNKGYLINKSKINNGTKVLLSTFKYDKKGRIIEEKHYTDGKLGSSLVSEHFGDTLSLNKQLNPTGEVYGISKFVTTVDQFGNPKKTIYYLKDEPKYIMNFEINYYK